MPDMLALHVALRYLRTRRAAWLALGAVTLTVAVPIVVLGVMQGFVDITYQQVRAAESDVVVQAGYAMPRDPAVAARLAAVPGVAAVAPFADNFAVMAPRRQDAERSDARYLIGCMVEGVDWTRDAAIERLQPKQLHLPPVTDLSAPPLPPERRGTGFLTPSWRAHLAWEGMALAGGLGIAPMPLHGLDRPRPGAIIGRELAYGKLGFLPVGREWQVIIPNGRGGTIGTIMVELSDTISTGVLAYDNTRLVVPLPWGQRLMGLHRDDSISGWRVRTEPGVDASDLALRSQAMAEPGWRVRTWEQLGSRNLVESLRLQRRILLIVMIAIQCICVFIVYAVFSTLVAEKRHDIGVLLGLGAPRRQIAGVFLLAGLSACLFGGLFGWIGGWSVLASLNWISQTLDMPLFPQDVFYSPETPISWSPLYPLLFIGIICVIGVLATLLPAWRAARIDPVHTLRGLD